MGISPAHAGNTHGVKTGPGQSVGSAPHMRGILQAWGHHATRLRISPAHAGNTDPSETAGPTARDQPRTCGEYAADGAPVKPDPGSAPHMRGIRYPPRGRHRRPRISPAHAGNTIASVTWDLSATDQPRTCGEYGSQRVGQLGVRGSAPHMRGIPTVMMSAMMAVRISPAHAGNTHNSEPAPSPSADQPRTCGEY